MLLGVALVVIHLTQRDKDGYYTSSTLQVAAPGYAATSEGLDVGNLRSFATDAVGRVRVSARSSTGKPLFVGIASQNAVNGYLAGAARSEVTEVNGNTVSYKTHAGGAPAATPARERFWQSSSSGSSQVTTTWNVKGGTWVIVLMNSSGASPGQHGRTCRRKDQPAALGRPWLASRRTDCCRRRQRNGFEEPLTVTYSQAKVHTGALAGSAPDDRWRRRVGGTVAIAWLGGSAATLGRAPGLIDKQQWCRRDPFRRNPAAPAGSLASGFTIWVSDRTSPMATTR